MTHTWPEIQLTMSEVDDGLLVEQEIIGGPMLYKARGWKLTPELILFVDICIRHGLRFALQNSHPKLIYRGVDGKGAPYISFGREYGDGWLCSTLGGYGSKLPVMDLSRILIRNRTGFEQQLNDANLPYDLEGGVSKAV